MIRLLLSLFVLAILIGTGIGYLLFSRMAAIPGPLQQNKIIYIAPGTPVNGIALQLKSEAAIDAVWVFRLQARLQAQAGTLKAGEYEIKAQASVNDILDVLRLGKTYQRQLTIPEGLMSFEIANLINAAEMMTGEIVDIPPEGSLLPDTYSYTRHENRTAFMVRLQTRMQQTVEQLWQARAENLPLKTPQEAVILASVVEKETGVASERAKVAGVFINRLRRGMPLQSDPTSIYALTEGKFRLDRALLRKDLEIKSPYNTYQVNGLPPGPIANPGKAALEAALQPESHDYLYFVADGTGGHAFGKTLAEHNDNVARWRALQKTKK